MHHYSNTTLVKVKFAAVLASVTNTRYSNTTLVKVKCQWADKNRILSAEFKYNSC